MKAQEAVDILQKAIWRPGMEVRAHVVYSDPYSPALDTIAVELVFDTFDSSVVTPAYTPGGRETGKYTERRQVAPVGGLPVGDLDETQLLYRVLRMVREANEHEDREFLRVLKNGRWTAPFHPHNDDSNDLWDRLERKPVGWR